jgi:hypothetical protein
MEVLVVAQPGSPPGSPPPDAAPVITMLSQDSSGNFSNDTSSWAASINISNPDGDGIVWIVQGIVPAGRDGWSYAPVGMVTFSGTTYLARLPGLQIGKLAATLASGDDADAATALAQLEAQSTTLASMATSIAGIPAPPSAAAIAAAVLSQGVAAVESSADPHSLAYVILAMSEWAIPAGHANELTVYRTDGVTPFATKTLIRQSNAKAIVSVK